MIDGIRNSPIGADWQPAVRTGVFFSWGDSALSRVISRITGGPSHIGIVFELADGSQVYYENLFGKGFCGPQPLDHLRDWARWDASRSVAICWFELSPAISEIKHLVAHTWVGLVGYAELKLVSFLLFELIGNKLGSHIRPAWNRWVCSTSAATILCPEVDLAGTGRKSSEVTPRSALDEVLARKLASRIEIIGDVAWHGTIPRETRS